MRRPIVQSEATGGSTPRVVDEAFDRMGGSSLNRIAPAERRITQIDRESLTGRVADIVLTQRLSSYFRILLTICFHW